MSSDELVLTDQTLQVLAIVAPVGVRHEFWVAHDLTWRGGLVRSDILYRLADELARLCEQERARGQVCWLLSPWGLFAAHRELDQALARLPQQPASFIRIRAWDVARDGTPPPFTPPDPLPHAAVDTTTATPAGLPRRQPHHGNHEGDA